MEVDDNIRTRCGVVTCLRDMGNGTSRLFIDDVKSDDTKNPIQWSHEWFVLFSPELRNESIEKMEFDDDFLRTVGAAIVARCFILNDQDT
jgi:hypothetical protein